MGYSKTKICRQCGETIYKGAKMCPFCHSDQPNTTSLGKIIAMVSIVSVLVIGVAFSMIITGFNEGVNRSKSNFSQVNSYAAKSIIDQNRDYLTQMDINYIQNNPAEAEAHANDIKNSALSWSRVDPKDSRWVYIKNSLKDDLKKDLIHFCTIQTMNPLDGRIHTTLQAYQEKGKDPVLKLVVGAIPFEKGKATITFNGRLNDETTFLIDANKNVVGINPADIEPYEDSFTVDYKVLDDGIQFSSSRLFKKLNSEEYAMMAIEAESKGTADGVFAPGRKVFMYNAFSFRRNCKF